ncbi:RAP protein, putative [Plasmodium malariae]|uniref:RAP protein, putative n=1 Tax=Plasmodium malariae TaxID=5858 RepID=A0A1C3KDD9_PLAMA|nr:RAP protein, putative [Plasmodium malariae]
MFSFKPFPNFTRRIITKTIRRTYSSCTKISVQNEEKKIKNVLLYLEKCILEEKGKNEQLLSFKTKNEQEDKVEQIRRNLLITSYLLKNMQANEQKWLSIFELVSTLCPLDEQTLKKKSIKLKQKNDEKNKEQYASVNHVTEFQNNKAINKISKEYNLLNLYSCYVFSFKTSIDRLLNYLPMYSIHNYILILKHCANFLNFFFKINNRKNFTKLNYIYIYSYNHNYMNNSIILKNKNEIVVGGKDKLDITYYYEEIYNLKYHEIFVYKIKLISKILNTIKYDLMERDIFCQLAIFFYTKTKNGIIIEKNILDLLYHYVEQLHKNSFIKHVDVQLFFKIINIMYYSKIVSTNVLQHIIGTLKNINLSFCQFCKKEIFQNYLKLLTLVNLNEHNFYIYNFCKYYILNIITRMSKHHSNIYNFFFVSCIIGMFDFSLIALYIKFLRQNKKINLKESLTHKIYYTLLGWDIMLSGFIKNVNKIREEATGFVKINFYTKHIYHTCSNSPSYDLLSLSHEINHLKNIYKGQIYIQKYERKNNRKTKKVSTNYYLNQYSIYQILKKHFNDNVTYEHITDQKILLDIFLKIRKKNYCKNVAVEFNGRTHYNLLVQKEIGNNNVHYTMIENYNTKYKKWLISNLPFSAIYIPYYEWNNFPQAQREKYLMQVLHFEK